MAAEGHYTLIQAARLVARHVGENAETMRQKLAQAVVDKTLKTEVLGGTAGHRGNTSTRLNEKASWNELNNWLQSAEPQIAWRFPNPVVPTENPIWASEYNFANEVNWQDWAEFVTLTPLQAILLMHGLNPDAYKGEPPPRVLDDVLAQEFFKKVRHRLAVATSEGLGNLPPAEWLAGADKRDWIVHAEFRAMASAGSAAQKTRADSAAPRSPEMDSPAAGMAPEIPKAEPSTEAPMPVAAETDVSTRGLTKSVILAPAWPLNRKYQQSSLERDLGDPPQWLLEARIAPGRRGGPSAVWSPAMLAVCLHEKGYASLPALEKFMAAHFHDWSSEWEVSSEPLRPEIRR